MSTSTIPPTRSAAVHPAAPSTLRVGVARGSFELKQFFREKDAVVFTFAFPILLLLIFGSVFSDDITPGVSFSQYFVAGMIASGLLTTSFHSLAIWIAQERDDGTLKRLAGTPMPRPSYFLGKVILVLVTSLAQVAILVATGALLFDLELPTQASRWLTFAWVAVLGTTACTLLGIAFSSVPRSGRAAPAVVTPIVIVLQFISGVFFVFSALPGWMQQVASVFPLRWMTQGMRSVFLPDTFQANEAVGAWELDRVALILGAWVVVGLALCLRTFRWKGRDAG
jgi:ABC-2 type transport system permease protein